MIGFYFSLEEFEIKKAVEIKRAGRFTTNSKRASNYKGKLILV
jgi:hypothetical protein